MLRRLVDNAKGREREISFALGWSVEETHPSFCGRHADEAQKVGGSDGDGGGKGEKSHPSSYILHGTARMCALACQAGDVSGGRRRLLRRRSPRLFRLANASLALDGTVQTRLSNPRNHPRAICAHLEHQDPPYRPNRPLPPLLDHSPLSPIRNRLIGGVSGTH